MRAALVGLFLMGCSAPATLPYHAQLVVRAYLYAYQPVTDVEITSTIPLSSTDTVGAPISDAVVTLTRRGVRYGLAPNPSAPGYYSYAGTDLTVAIGDTFDLEVVEGGSTATATAVVPPAPAGLTLSGAEFIIDTTDGAPANTIVAHWDNPADDYVFTVINSAEANPRRIPGLPSGSGGGQTTNSAFSAPAQSDSAVVALSSVRYLGRTRLRVFRVPPAYVALYQSRQQDSRDLNEPATNIHGALGIFAAFASDSVFFNVIGG
jgi:uncharacterized protein DUF4249